MGGGLIQLVNTTDLHLIGYFLFEYFKTLDQL